MENKDLQNEIVNSAAEKAAQITNEALETKTASINETLETKASTEDVLKLAKSIDEVKEMATKGFGIGKKRNGYEEMAEYAKSEMEKLTQRKSGDFVLNTKDFGIADGADNYQAYRETMSNSIKFDPNHQTRLRNFVSMMSAPSSGAYRYNQESTAPAAADTKAKGASGTNLAPVVSPVIAPIQTIQAFTTIPEEHMSDINAISEYLNVRLVGQLMDAEDTQILTGSGTSPDLEGINVGAATANKLTTAALADAFFGAAFDNAIDEANNYDVLNAVAGELEADNFRPSACVINPADLRALGLIKSTQGEYVLTQAVDQGRIVWYFMGLELIPNAAQAQGTYTVFDKNCVTYALGQGVEYRFGYNDDDFISNNISVRANLRGALAVERPNGVVTGTFGIAKTALETA